VRLEEERFKAATRVEGGTTSIALWPTAKRFSFIATDHASPLRITDVSILQESPRFQQIPHFTDRVRLFTFARVTPFSASYTESENFLRSSFAVVSIGQNRSDLGTTPESLIDVCPGPSRPRSASTPDQSPHPETIWPGTKLSSSPSRATPPPRSPRSWDAVAAPVQNWVAQYNRGGLPALQEQPTPGARPASTGRERRRFPGAVGGRAEARGWHLYPPVPGLCAASWRRNSA